MNFLESDLGFQSGGAVVRVVLRGHAANVFLVDASNRSAYKQNRGYKYYGGHFTRSPAALTVPRAAHWYLIIDTGGYSGRVTVESVEVLAA